MDNIVYQTKEEGASRMNSFYEYHDNTYMLISKIAYLIGVPKRIFENEYEPPKLSFYEELDQNKNARIIRNLCIIRTAIERNYTQINSLFTYEMKNITTVPDLIPTESITELSDDGVSIVKANYRLNQYIIDINKQINDKINNCKSVMPIWIKWEYIRELFIMPNGTKESGIRSAATEYYGNLNAYPYQMYINWSHSNQGNILYCDRKFAELLYEAHFDSFKDLSKVTDAGERTKGEIYDYLDNSKRVVIIVDCENSDPFKLYATLNNLDENALLQKVVKIILLDDVHTTTAWGILNEFTNITIEHIMLKRLKEEKSYLDVQLTARTCKEHYENNIDSFVLVSSDSDYWGMINELENVKFFVMVESGKCSAAIRQALDSSGIMYCFIDNFSTGNSNEIKERALLNEIYASLEEYCNFNIDEVLNEAYTATRAVMTDAEKTQFYKKYIKPMRLVVDDDGEVYIKLGE